MNPRTVEISVLSQSIDTLFLALGVHLAQALGLPEKGKVTVRLGNNAVKVRIKALQALGKDQRCVVYFGARLASAMMLIDGIRLGTTYDEHSNTLRLGPVVGVLAMGKGRAEPYGQITELLREITQAGQMQGAYVYVFSPGEIDLHRGCIQGRVYDIQRKIWHRGVFPYPDVVYDRIYSRGHERFFKVITTKRILREKVGAQFLNADFLSKWEVHKTLAANDDVGRYLPDTRPCTGIKMVLEMVERYGLVYLKPVHSSQGLGICWIRKKTTGGYFGQYNNWVGQERAWYTKDKQGLSDYIKKMVSKHKYVIQQGLQLVLYHGKPSDIRLLMQKTGQGKWQLTTWIGRVAVEGSRISNSGHGGQLIPVYELLAKTIGTNTSLYKKQKARFEEVGMRICSSLETAMGMQFAELGLDMALDRDQKLWLIEANAKPARDFPREEAVGQKVPRRSLRHIIDYARYLTEI